MSDPDAARRADDARAWRAKADDGFLNIENNLAARPIPWDTVCFHAQQGVERLLQAFLIGHGRVPARTHDLIALLADCAAISPALGSLHAECALLNVYAVATRYPGSGIEPNGAVGPDVVAAARRVRAAVAQ